MSDFQAFSSYTTMKKKKKKKKIYIEGMETAENSDI
jgi:hypothetical protein